MIDLHLHTHHSDGTFTPEEVVQRAKAAGLSAISLTDHDTIAGLAGARQAAGTDLEVLSGVELTVVFQDRELHLLGYGFRESDPALARYLSLAQANRHGRIQEMIDLLRQRGIEVTLEEVQAVAGQGNSIGRPHLAEVLVKKRIVGSLNEAFDRYLGDHASCFVKRATLSVAEAARLVREAGGVSVLAHPHRIVQDEWIPALVEQGIQGIEVYHSDHGPSVTEWYRKVAKELGLLITGGSDCHGFRKSKGPLLGTVPVPMDCLGPLKAAIRP